MALAALSHAKEQSARYSILEADNQGRQDFRNDWQTAVPESPTHDDLRQLASDVQDATEASLLACAMRAKSLSCESSLVVSGGVFMNIPTNTRIADSGAFARYYVASAPGDAGISIGCAMYAESQLAGRLLPFEIGILSDRLGKLYSTEQELEALSRYAGLLQVVEGSVTPRKVAELVHSGAIIARSSGRSEFGPRALGGRSILASPLRISSKTKLNSIKSRQEWRPVAPTVADVDFDTFFEGPRDSHFMSYVHKVREPFRGALPALGLPNESVRTQVLKREWDEYLFELLQELGSISGFPIICNTSLNTRGEPIVETPEDSILFLLRCSDVDYLLLGNKLIERASAPREISAQVVRLNPEAELSTIFVGGRLESKATLGTHKTALTFFDYERLLTLRTETLIEDALRYGDVSGNEASLSWLQKFIGERLLNVGPIEQ
ncbi:MAG: hypothetical protein IPF38_15670 [Burkholderiales bacterium]|nr:hypothetical protein [Burkholderiales bacterium]